jgi:hypothetical protein
LNELHLSIQHTLKYEFQVKILACLVHRVYGAIALLMATDGLVGGALRKNAQGDRLVWIENREILLCPFRRKGFSRSSSWRVLGWRPARILALKQKPRRPEG